MVVMTAVNNTALAALQQTKILNKQQSPPLRKKPSEDPLRDFRERMTRFARASDRKNVLKTMKESKLLESITLDATPALPANEDEFAVLEKQVCSTRFDMNGISLGPGCHASSPMEVKRILKQVCEKLAVSSTELTAEALYAEVVIRLAEQTTRTDAHNAMDKIIGIPQLMLQNPKNVAIELPYAQVFVYESFGQVHAVFDNYCAFGLYRKLDVGGGKPWIKLTTALHERVNLTTAVAVRTLEVTLPHK